MTLKELSQLYYLNREIERDKVRLAELQSKAYEASSPNLSGEGILFQAFLTYTSVEGFAAYVLKGDEEYKSILINRSHIQQIFID